MALTKAQAAVFAGAAALRLFLSVAFPGLQTILTHRVEVSTPVNSFKRLQEGLYFYTHNVSPYDGGAPLFLPLFALLPSYRDSPIWTNLVYIIADLLAAVALLKIAESGEAASSRLFTSPRKGPSWSPTSIAAAYLLNPFTVVTCLAQPTSIFTNCAILHAIAAALQNNLFNATLAIAMAAYFSIYPILLAPPLLLLAYDRRKVLSKDERLATFSINFVVGLFAAIAALQGISYVICDFSWQFLWSTYGPHILLSDLTPNVGLWWYFFIEMFDSFRNFFLAVFWLHMVSYVGGITIRLRRQPLFAIVFILGSFTVFKPYPSIADTSLYLSLIPLYRHIFPLIRYGFIAAAVLIYATFLGPAFYHLWIYAGSGNANFFYAITLVWSLGFTIVLGDTLWAVLRDEAEADRPELKDRELCQI